MREGGGATFRDGRILAFTGELLANGGLGARDRFRPRGNLSTARRGFPEFLREPDENAFRSADIGQSIRLPILHFPDQLGPMRAHAREDLVEVFDAEHDATDAQHVKRRLHRPVPNRLGRVELVQLDEECLDRFEVFHHDEDVIHPFERHGPASIIPEGISLQELRNFTEKAGLERQKAGPE